MFFRERRKEETIKEANVKRQEKESKNTGETIKERRRGGKFWLCYVKKISKMYLIKSVHICSLRILTVIPLLINSVRAVLFRSTNSLSSRTHVLP